jgi:hypothetical protein
MPRKPQDDPKKAQDYTEIHRIRIVNRPDGAIQLSTDRGKTWYLIGRVLFPAQGVIEGYIAAEYASQGSVAAIAVHGIHMRVSEKDPTLHAPLVISIQPKEYATQRQTGACRNCHGHTGGHLALSRTLAAGRRHGFCGRFGQ